LHTPEGQVLSVTFPAGSDLPALGQEIRLLTRLKGQQGQHASLELLGFALEADLTIISAEGAVIPAPKAPAVALAAPAFPRSFPQDAAPLPATPTDSVPAAPATGVTSSWPSVASGATPGAYLYYTPTWAYTGPSPYAAPTVAPQPADQRVAAYAALIARYNSKLSEEWRIALAKALLYYCDWYGVQPALAFALIACESSWNPKSVSHAGAMGLGQLMPGTAAGLGVSDPFDPIANLAASIRLLRGHLEKYQGRPYGEQLALALACYNAGSGAVQRYGGVPPYSETINYIRKVSNLFVKLYEQGYR